MFFECSVPERLVVALDEILETEKNRGNAVVGTATIDGFQTNTVHDRPEYQAVINELMSFVPSEHGPLKCVWFHLIDYDRGGHQLEHDHAKTEDFSFIVYMTSLKDGGRTWFRLPNENYLVSAPSRGKLLFFPAHLKHWGEPVEDSKRVAVAALKKAN